MEFRKLKKGERLVLDDIKIEEEIVDGNIRSMLLRAPSGACAKICATYYGNSLEVVIPKEPEEVERFMVAGTIIDLPILEYYEEEWKAKDRLSEIKMNNGDATLSKVKVVLDAEGKAVSGSGDLT